MKIKRFFELFDTEDIKSTHEIDYLSGNFSNLGKTLDYNFKDEGIAKFIHKLSSYHYPFFTAFEQTVKDEKDLVIDGVRIYVSHDDEEDGYWAFVATNDRITVGFGIKINQVNNYDVFIYFDDEEHLEVEEKNPGVEYEGLTYSELIPIIKEIYIPFLIDAGFEKLIEYNTDKSINN